jgi:hypothetical protein
VPSELAAQGRLPRKPSLLSFCPVRVRARLEDFRGIGGGIQGEGHTLPCVDPRQEVCPNLAPQSFALFRRVTPWSVVQVLCQVSARTSILSRSFRPQVSSDERTDLPRVVSVPTSVDMLSPLPSRTEIGATKGWSIWRPTTLPRLHRDSRLALDRRKRSTDKRGRTDPIDLHASDVHGPAPLRSLPGEINQATCPGTGSRLPLLFSGYCRLHELAEQPEDF